MSVGDMVVQTKNKPRLLELHTGEQIGRLTGVGGREASAATTSIAAIGYRDRVEPEATKGRVLVQLSSNATGPVNKRTRTGRGRIKRETSEIRFAAYVSCRRHISWYITLLLFIKHFRLDPCTPSRLLPLVRTANHRAISRTSTRPPCWQRGQRWQR